MSTKHPPLRNIFLAGTLLALCTIGIWARWQYTRTDAFHVDEFISLLAIRTILETGQPILPSGFYYDNGLLFSYLAAALASLKPDDLFFVRWLSIGWGAVTIFLIYITAWQLFGSQKWALVGAALFALFPEAIEWGGRVRMYAQANVVLLLWILLSWWGTVGGARRWARWLFIITLWTGLNTHFVLVLLLPPLFLSIGIVVMLADTQRHHQPDTPASSVGHISRLWQKIDHPQRLLFEAGVATLVFVLTIWLASNSFMARYAVETPNLETGVYSSQSNVSTSILDLTPDTERLGTLYRYLIRDKHLPLSVFALIGVIILLTRLARRQGTVGDWGGLLVASLLMGVFFELMFVINSEWGKTRYNYLLILIPLLLLAVYGLQSIEKLLAARLRSTSWQYISGAMVLSVGGLFWPLLSFWPETQAIISGRTDTANQYQAAFEYVDENREPSDQLATIRPAAGHLFSEQLDYYANQYTAVIAPSPQGWIDRYAGVPYLEDVSDLNDVLDNASTLWFVIDDRRLFENFSPAFTQQVLQRMAVAYEKNNVITFREIDKWPLAETPDHLIEQTLQDGLTFRGYTPTSETVGPGELVHLTLFWQGGDALVAYKVFVHLRDSQGQNITQADFQPLIHLDDKLREELIDQAEEEFIRLGTTLTIPMDSSSGDYTLWAGLYDADTLDRLLIVDDPEQPNEILLGSIRIE